jgi:hypothetical protein
VRPKWAAGSLLLFFFYFLFLLFLNSVLGIEKAIIFRFE